MRLRSLAALVAVVVLSTVARAQQPDPRLSEPSVKVGLFTSRPDGSGGSAYATNENGSLKGLMYVEPCSYGAMDVNKRVPELALAAWRIDGQVLGLNAQQATVRLGWQRLRAGGGTLTEAPTVREFTVPFGGATTLDSVTVPAVSGCPETLVKFDLRYETRNPPPPRMVAPIGGSRGGVKSMGTGAGGSVATVASAVGSVGAIPSSSAGGGGKVQPNGFTFVGAGSNRGFTGYQRAELWLVHSAPRRPDEVLMTSTIATTTVGDFAFAPVAVQAPTGVITVRVTGTVELGRDATGAPRLVFGARRRTSFVASTRQPRDGDASVESGGVASTVVAMPGPDEVLSFEMPALQGAGVPSVPDTFAIRLRLSPVTTPTPR